jgi:GxxExxY protein
LQLFRFLLERGGGRKCLNDEKCLNYDFKDEKNTMIERYKYQELTGTIIGAAMEVHGYLGNGFQEVVYQRALAIELGMRNIEFVREMEMPLVYKGFDIGTRRVDFFIEEKIMLEIKAVVKLEDVHLAQAINYLEAYGLEIGLLINFGNSSLQFKRVMKPQRNHSPS